MRATHPLAGQYRQVAAHLLEIGREIDAAGHWGGEVDSDREIAGYLHTLHAFFVAEDKKLERGEFDSLRRYSPTRPHSRK